MDQKLPLRRHEALNWPGYKCPLPSVHILSIHPIMDPNFTLNLHTRVISPRKAWVIYVTEQAWKIYAAVRAGTGHTDKTIPQPVLHALYNRWLLEPDEVKQFYTTKATQEEARYRSNLNKRDQRAYELLKPKPVEKKLPRSSYTEVQVPSFRSKDQGPSTSQQTFLFPTDMQEVSTDSKLSLVCLSTFWMLIGCNR